MNQQAPAMKQTGKPHLTQLLECYLPEIAFFVPIPQGAGKHFLRQPSVHQLQLPYVIDMLEIVVNDGNRGLLPLKHVPCCAAENARPLQGAVLLVQHTRQCAEFLAEELAYLPLLVYGKGRLAARAEVNAKMLDA